MNTKSKFARFAKAVGQFLLLLWLIIGIGCTPTADETEATAFATVTIEPRPTDMIEATGTPTAALELTATSTPTVAPTPSLPPDSVATLTDEFKIIMDPEVCPRACYLGLTIGQTKEDVLTIIQEFDIIDIQIKDEEDPIQGTTSIRWQWEERLLPFVFDHNGGVTFREGYSLAFGLPPRELIPISLILEEFGEPDYMDVHGDDAGLWYYDLIYLQEDAVIRFSAWGFVDRPTSLSANTLLQWVGIREKEDFFTWVCDWQVKFQEWKGYGGLGVYYDEYGNPLDEVSIIECPDREWDDGWDNE